MDEPRTIRDARLVVRSLERDVNGVRMAPAAALVGFGARWYLHRAQAALRQAERAFARADDPRLEPLKPLAPQVERSLRPPAERRKRYRCTECFVEVLREAADVERHPYHYRPRKVDSGYERVHCGEWQVVPPLRRSRK